MKEALHKRMHSVWSHLCEVLEQAKPIYDGKDTVGVGVDWEWG